MVLGPGRLSQAAALRWTYLGICLAVTIAVGGAVLSNFFGARALNQSVTSGHAAMIFQLIQRSVPRSTGPTQASLETALVEGESLGLRYIGMFRGDAPMFEVGTPRAPHEQLQRSPRVDVRDGVARTWAPHSLGRGQPLGGRGPSGSPRGPGFEGKARQGPPGSAPGMRDFGRRPLGPPLRPPAGPQMVIEFEPVLASAMRTRARRNLWIGVLSIAVLWGAAALYWRLSQRAAQTELRLAQRKHLASLGEMSAVIAHELRNPLASLKGHAQLLLEQTETPKLRAKAERVVQEAVRLQALSAGLLEFVRSGRVERTSVDIKALVREAAAGSVARVESDMNAAPARWSLDAARIRQVLNNLLDNGAQAAAGEPVALVVSTAQGRLRLDVLDRGPGVVASRRHEIFKPFQSDRAQGTGLGLAVCQHIVELHDGTIEVLDREGGGACFRVELPAASAPPQP